MTRDAAARIASAAGHDPSSPTAQSGFDARAADAAARNAPADDDADEGVAG
jgi:hypothetical protein